MAKKTQLVSGGDNMLQNPTRQLPFYDHMKARAKPHSTDGRATVGLRFGRAVALCLNAVFAHRQKKNFGNVHN